MKKDVFISYSSKDFDKVNSVKNILEINGISCWMAPQCIHLDQVMQKKYQWQ